MDTSQAVRMTEPNDLRYLPPTFFYGRGEKPLVGLGYWNLGVPVTRRQTPSATLKTAGPCSHLDSAPRISLNHLGPRRRKSWDDRTSRSRRNNTRSALGERRPVAGFRPRCSRALLALPPFTLLDPVAGERLQPAPPPSFLARAVP